MAKEHESKTINEENIWEERRKLYDEVVFSNHVAPRNLKVSEKEFLECLMGAENSTRYAFALCKEFTADCCIDNCFAIFSHDFSYVKDFWDDTEERFKNSGEFLIRYYDGAPDEFIEQEWGDTVPKDPEPAKEYTTIVRPKLNPYSLEQIYDIYALLNHNTLHFNDELHSLQCFEKLKEDFESNPYDRIQRWTNKELTEKFNTYADEIREIFDEYRTVRRINGLSEGYIPSILEHIVNKKHLTKEDFTFDFHKTAEENISDALNSLLNVVDNENLLSPQGKEKMATLFENIKDQTKEKVTACYEKYQESMNQVPLLLRGGLKKYYYDKASSAVAIKNGQYTFKELDAMYDDEKSLDFNLANLASKTDEYKTVATLATVLPNMYEREKANIDRYIETHYVKNKLEELDMRRLLEKNEAFGKELLSLSGANKPAKNESFAFLKR